MKGKELKQILSGGYWTVTVKTERYEDRTQRPEAVHRLVCLAFKGVPPKSKPIARHMDDDRDNNSSSNIKWGSYSDNRNDAVRNDRKCGAQSKLSPKQLASIRKLFASGKTQKELATKFNISQSRVSQLVNE